MKKRRLKLLSLFLAASLTVPTAAGSVRFFSDQVQEVKAAGEESVVGKSASYLEDGVNDNWMQDEGSVKGDDAVCALENGWLHVKSGLQNGNNPGSTPAIFLHPGTFDFDSEGYFSFTLKSNNANTGSTDCDRFGVYLGYNSDRNGMYVGYDNGGWFWQKYMGGNGDWYQGSRYKAPVKGEEIQVRLDWTSDHKMTLTIDGETVFYGEDFSGISGVLGSTIALKGGTYGSVTDVLLKNIHYTGQKQAAAYQVTGKVTDQNGQPVEGSAVTIGDIQAVTGEDGTYRVELPDGVYSVTAVKEGYQTGIGSVTVSGGETKAADIVLVPESEVETETISSKLMDVFVARDFPSVVRYEMKGDLAGKIFYGQTAELRTLRINGVDVKVTPENVKADFSEDKAVYTMSVKDEANHIDAVMKATLTVKENDLQFAITDIKNNLEGETTKNRYGQSVETYPLETIAVPNHSLISVRTTQEGANLKGAVMSSNTHMSGDEYIEVENDMQTLSNRDYMYAFVSNQELSAGMWSNSEHEGRVVAAPVKGGSQNTRIYATTEDRAGYRTLGLASAEWYYHRNITDSKGETYTVKETELPKCAVTIAADMNEDQKIDWQDGAIAFRDIMNNPYKSEEVPELVAWRIAMNFGSQAQNPFLTSLDNVKKVALNTDGLGQSVLLKGYASEGHDSGHPDYDNIGERLGGIEDMNTLMEKGAVYGARFGIHVNASEMYPEAKAFDENLVRRNETGALSYGWNWLDQGVGIDGIYDLGSGMRQQRFNSLKEKVGDNMDFVYVDVWGNLTSSSAEDSWETRKLSKMITDNGWRMTTEWGSGNEYDSTFQHWATDLTYGGYTSKGENSEVMRFLRNHQKDSWVGDYPSYGGVANAPLLGGYNMKDFEGWQGRNNYDAYITNLYTHDLMTKFLQHYQVVDWEDGEPVQMSDNDETYSWTPEKTITLKADPQKASSETDVVTVTRGSTNPSDAAYRDRTVTLNGIVISKGAVSRGDTGADGTESYLLPWNWDPKTGENVSSDNEKLYHWNTQGGETTWELQNGWKNLKSVKVYKLTDLGKTEEQTVDVTGGCITLNAQAQTPYVVCKGEEGNFDITWSEGMHIADAGFNAGNEGLSSYWKKEGDGSAEIARSQYSNPMLKMDGMVSMTQELTDLKPGQTYAVYVGVDNRSSAKASISVKTGKEVLDTNYTERSIAKNYVKAYSHSNSSATVDGSSYFQNMYVFFTAPKDGKVTLTLEREAGDGSTYFDDIRVVASKMDTIKKDKAGRVTGLEQNFENSVQGVYPFVIGGIEGVEDNRTHLSEMHAPYTQAGWDVKKMDDVLTKADPDSRWSVKVNGLCGRGSLVMQTIPQNFRFEPGRKYKVSFDYQSGTDGIYGLMVGNGEYTGSETVSELPMAMGEQAEATYSFELIGADSGQSWFGIYSTSKAADIQGSDNDAGNFGGYKDFVLDNLKIELVEETVTADDLKVLIQEAEEKYVQSDYQETDWKNYQEVLTKVKVVLHKDKQNAQEIEDAYYALRAQIQSMDMAAGAEASDAYDIPADQYTVQAGSVQEASGNEGPAELALDGNADTHWHTNWYENAIRNGTGWYQFDFAETKTVTGVRYLPRSGGQNVNGKIKKANVLISKDSGESWESAAENVDLDLTTVWQKIDFGQNIEGVTNVRIVALETAGQSAAEENKFASAAELRVTQPVDPGQAETDKSGLLKAIQEASALNKDQYTAETWAVVEEKLQVAKAVCENPDASQFDVALAIANLSDAAAGLEAVTTPEPEQPDKSGLENAVSDAGALDKNEYTTDSWSKYQEALTKAQAVLADESAAQADVEAALRALNIARAGLQKQEAVGGSQTEEQRGQSQKKNQNTSFAVQKEKGAARTDDEAPVVPVTGAMTAALAVLAAILKKKK